MKSGPQNASARNEKLPHMKYAKSFILEAPKYFPNYYLYYLYVFVK